MRRAWMVFLFFLLLSTVWGPPHDLQGDPSDGTVRAAAPTAALVFEANRTVAGRGDVLGYAVWLNLSGPGFLTLTWVNLTFDGNLTVDFSSVTTPSGCSRLVGLSWQCNGLRAGTHLWTLSAIVLPDSVPGVIRNASADATTYFAGTYTPVPVVVASVFVAGAELGILFREAPDLVRPREQLRFTIDAVNVSPGANDTAYNVTMQIEPDPSLILDPDTSLTVFVAQLTSGSVLSVSFAAILAENASVGGVIGVRVILEYEDFNFQSVGPTERSLSVGVGAPQLIPAASLLGAAAAFAVAILGTILALLVAGRLRIRIDELFLMHRSGVLIQHVSRTPALARDDDLIASMLVAVQDFVRDSFRSEATLEELSFGGRRAALVRGEHVVLAAILSSGNPRDLVPQLRLAVEDLERTHGPRLDAWDGRVARLERAGSVLSSLLAGSYRGARAWRGWPAGLRARRRRAR